MLVYVVNEMGETVLSSVDDCSVVDVYDIASDIGKECEKIIEMYGANAVTALMPKVINALELLEALATRNEHENTITQELNDRIAQLETEKLEKAEYRKRFEKELEAIEEQWRTETRDLVNMVSRLQETNRRLTKYQQTHQKELLSSGNNLNQDDLEGSSGHSSMESTSGGNGPSDGQMLQILRQQIEKQRNEATHRDRQLQEKSEDVENINLQLERLKNSGRESRRRQKMLQVQIRTLCEERADFLAQLQDQHREIVALRKRLGLAEKENEDLTKYQEDDLLRPRYTTAELKEILAERDDLKARINDLEEELKLFKPSPPLHSKKPIVCETPTDDDPPVQGPLPYEPDDAPWKKQSESGIRKFFRKLFTEPGTPSFPRRSLSTLSKMALSAGPHSDIPI